MADEGKDASRQPDEWRWTEREIDDERGQLAHRLHIAAKLLDLRKRAHLTERQLAEKLCYSHYSVWAWERGAQPVPLSVMARWIEVCEAEAHEWAKWEARLGA